MAELFAEFEVNRVPRWPLLTRLVMASVAAHGLFIVAVVYVPALNSLFRAAGTLAGIEFVSEDYDRSLIGQRATLVKLEPYEKLYYPPDYFMTESPLAPPMPGDPALVAQVAPSPLPVIRPRQIIPRVVPTPTPTPEPTPEVAAVTPTPSPSPLSEEERKKAEEAELEKVAKQNNIQRPPRINTKPFEEIAQKGKEMMDKGNLDLKSSVVDVSVTAERNEDGTLNRETVKIEGTANNEGISTLAQEFVNALSESKVLSVLDGAKEVRMTLKLDAQLVTIRVASEVASDARAAEMATGYGLLLLMARSRKEGTDEGELWKNVKVSSDGRQFIMTFEMPRDAAGKMLTDKLAKMAAPKG